MAEFDPKVEPTKASGLAGSATMSGAAVAGDTRVARTAGLVAGPRLGAQLAAPESSSEESIGVGNSKAGSEDCCVRGACAV
mmetsp:Transcript_49154/g.164116  ORF Transcript_49154/g.164116 Transcript_49154/m.164116 type:complete len:81 (-) Transcript_49154:2-244(-)